MIRPLSEEWAGDYFDGVTAERHSATVRLTSAGIEVKRADGQETLWPYSEVRQADSGYSSGRVRLERGKQPAEVLVIPDEVFLTALRQNTPRELQCFPDVRTQPRWDLTLLGIVGVLAAGAVLYFWGVRAVGSILARFMPVSWEERLGDAVLQSLAPEEARCEGTEKRAALDEMLRLLLQQLPQSRYQYKLTVMRGPLNAFAMPGGRIVVTDALLRAADTPEQLAGVLAHEIQHVEMRHSTQSLLRGISGDLVLAALGVDTTGGGMALKAAALLADLSHSREEEEAADREGMKLILAARLDPGGIVQMMEKLAELDIPGELKYFSTHPLGRERVTALRRLGDAADYVPQPLLPDVNWAETQGICACGPKDRAKEEIGVP